MLALGLMALVSMPYVDIRSLLLEAYHQPTSIVAKRREIPRKVEDASPFVIRRRKFEVSICDSLRPGDEDLSPGPRQRPPDQLNSGHESRGTRPVPKNTAYAIELLRPLLMVLNALLISVERVLMLAAEAKGDQRHNQGIRPGPGPSSSAIRVWTLTYILSRRSFIFVFLNRVFQRQSGFLPHTYQQVPGACAGTYSYARMRYSYGYFKNGPHQHELGLRNNQQAFEEKLLPLKGYEGWGWRVATLFDCWKSSLNCKRNLRGVEELRAGVRLDGSGEYAVCRHQISFWRRITSQLPLWRKGEKFHAKWKTLHRS